MTAKLRKGKDVYRLLTTTTKRPPAFLLVFMSRIYLVLSRVQGGVCRAKTQAGYRISCVLRPLVVRTVASVLYTISLQGPWYGNFSRELFCHYSYSNVHTCYAF
jgi:hypothetical protein